jgi:hypothetical protein
MTPDGLFPPPLRAAKEAGQKKRRVVAVESDGDEDQDEYGANEEEDDEEEEEDDDDFEGEEDGACVFSCTAHRVTWCGIQKHRVNLPRTPHGLVMHTKSVHS